MENSIKITIKEQKMLNEIMDCENDGVGMGYSEYDGLEISNEQKGVLSSLVKKGIVYNSYGNGCDSSIPMYCTTEMREKVEVS